MQAFFTARLIGLLAVGGVTAGIACSVIDNIIGIFCSVSRRWLSARFLWLRVSKGPIDSSGTSDTVL